MLDHIGTALVSSCETWQAWQEWPGANQLRPSPICFACQREAASHSQIGEFGGFGMYFGDLS